MEVGTAAHRAAVKEWSKDRGVEEQIRLLSELEMQADHLHWERVMAQDLTWNKLIYRMTDREVKFLLQALTNTAPTPSQLRRYGYLDHDNCPLCAEKGCSLMHVLSYCSVGLNQGRYTWRHNEELRLLHFEIGKLVRWMNPTRVLARPKKTAVKRFVKAGAEAKLRRSEGTVPILRLACDWKIMVDLPGSAYAFPLNVALTEKRPDLVLVSEQARIIVLLEHTAPAERNVRKASDRKQHRYANLVTDCEKGGYETFLFTVEVGVLGFIADSLRIALTAIGGKGLWKGLREEMESLGLRCSYAIYLQHKSLAWQPWRLYVPEKWGKTAGAEGKGCGEE